MCPVEILSFPALSCEFATLDVSDALGTKRMNLTKTLRKTPIDLNLDHHGAAYEDNHKVQPKYDDEDMWVSHLGCWGTAGTLAEGNRTAEKSHRACHLASSICSWPAVLLLRYRHTTG